MNKKEHWDNIYTTKQPHEVSWTQDIPEISLQLISDLQLSKDASIIDIGGGDSHLVDYLLELGYQDITVLDISEAAIHRAQNRLGKKAEQVHWIISDILDFEPLKKYDAWHDRAVFHFLISENEIEQYKELATRVAQNIVLGTFAIDGPQKCSGLEITQYDEAKLGSTFSPHYKLRNFLNHQHTTPFNTTQKFVFAILESQSS